MVNARGENFYARAIANQPSWFERLQAGCFFAAVAQHIC